jgi:hypothetical protein
MIENKIAQHNDNIRIAELAYRSTFETGRVTCPESLFFVHFSLAFTEPCTVDLCMFDMHMRKRAAY